MPQIVTKFLTYLHAQAEAKLIQVSAHRSQRDIMMTNLPCGLVLHVMQCTTMHRMQQVHTKFYYHMAHLASLLSPSYCSSPVSESYFSSSQ